MSDIHVRNSDLNAGFTFMNLNQKPALIIRADGYMEVGEGCTNLEAATELVELANRIAAQNKPSLASLDAVAWMGTGPNGGADVVTTNKIQVREWMRIGLEIVPLVKHQGAQQPAELAEQQGDALAAFNECLTPALRVPATAAYRIAILAAVQAATGKQQVVDLPDDVVERCRALPTDELLDCALEVYARSCRYGTKGQHDAAMAYKDEIIRRIDGCAAQVGEVQGDAEAMRTEWIAAGGKIHGPNVETVTMTEAGYFRFRAALAARQPGAQEPVGKIVSEFRDTSGYSPRIEWSNGDHPGVGTVLYAAPPARGIDLGQKAAHPDDIIVWADGTYCDRRDMREYAHMGDDYSVLWTDTGLWLAFVERSPNPEESNG